MKLNRYLFIVPSIVFLSFAVQRNPIQKQWRLVAEEITYLNFDYTRYDGARDRLDSIKNETVQFLPDGSFRSREGNGTYALSKDSIHLSIDGKNMSFKYQLSNTKLVMESQSKESRYIVRSRLYLE